MTEKVEIPSVFIIDDEVEVGKFFRHLLERKGYRVTVANCGGDAVKLMDTHRFHVAMVDLKLPDSDGLTLLQEMKARLPRCEVIIMTGYSTTRTAVKAIQLGAFDYVEKPFEDIGEIETLVQRAVDFSLGNRNAGEAHPEWAHVSDLVGFQVGSTLQMSKMVSIAFKIARKNINVLIQGETGTGKEVLARFIHAASSRADKMFIPINCGALPENLLDSELFGHEKGAFTGAAGQRKGIFELANNGTLFLDEIGEASMAIQVKLLRVLETGEFLRVGGEKSIRTDVRIIAATNVDLEQAVKNREFREDLFYRLDVVRLGVPPLRDRKVDIPRLVKHFIKRSASGVSRYPEMSPEAMELLINYGWPGNIRELANTVEQAVALCDGPVIMPAHIPDKIACRTSAESALKENVTPDSLSEWLEKAVRNSDRLNSLPPEQLYRVHRLLKALERQVGEAMLAKGLPLPPPSPLEEVEARVMTEALAYHNGNVTLAAKALGIGRNTLYRKIKDYNIAIRG